MNFQTDWLIYIIVVSGILIFADYFFLTRKRDARAKTPTYVSTLYTVFSLALITLLIMLLGIELFLFCATVFCGVVALIDIIFFARKRGQTQKMPILFEYARAFFPILLIVFFLRSFLFEPFRIPSGSLKPTVNIGDFILVNKFNYGIRLPVLHYKIFKIGDPKRGDIMVFRWPPNPSVDFIKRVIGVPGDRISYIDKVLYVNGEKISQTYIKDVSDYEESVSTIMQLKQENLMGLKHDIFQNPNRLSEDYRDIVVPKGMYFMMGDNRDNSEDSRFWGFVPEENIVGKASLVWMSFDFDNHAIRWKRIGKLIH